MTTITLKKGPTDSEGRLWYETARLNRLAQINGERLFGESTMKTEKKKLNIPPEMGEVATEIMSPT